MGTILFIISVILSIVLYPLGFIYSIIRLSIGANFKTLYKRIDQLLRKTAIAVDQLGNVWMQELLNDLLIKIDMYQEVGGEIIVNHPHNFGDEDETISSVLGKNKEKKTLTHLGKFVCWALNKIDPNHVENSVE